MKTLDEVACNSISQQPAIRDAKKAKAICKEKIESLLSLLEYNEIIELLDEVAYEQFAKGEMAGCYIGRYPGKKMGEVK